MDLRLMISRLADLEARKAAARWLFAACCLGFVISMAGLAASGHGLQRWIFVALFWTVLVFIPLRIALESLQAVGAGMRQKAAERFASDPGRYNKPAVLPFVIRALSDREAVLPRICTPQHAQQAREAAVAIVGATAGRADAAEDLRRAIRTLLAAAADCAAAVSVSATGEAADNIQARWEGARALGALGALLRILGAAYADRWGLAPDLPELEDRTLGAYLDAVLDYCDEAALQVDTLPWTEPPLKSPMPTAGLEEIRTTWRAFLAAGTPAPRALTAFVRTVLTEPPA
jgi:hypothetical protein